MFESVNDSMGGLYPSSLPAEPVWQKIVVMLYARETSYEDGPVIHSLMLRSLSRDYLALES